MLRRYKLKVPKTLNLGGILCLLTTVYAIYYCILNDSFLPFSVSSLLAWGAHYSKQWHVLAVGLIPIYLAMVIYGAGVISITLGSAFQRWITRRWQ